MAVPLQNTFDDRDFVLRKVLHMRIVACADLSKRLTEVVNRLLLDPVLGNEVALRQQQLAREVAVLPFLVPGARDRATQALVREMVTQHQELRQLDTAKRCLRRRPSGTEGPRTCS
jgi:hypothetical protein